MVRDTSLPFVPPPLRACLISGGASQRMGRDKALLPHPEGGTWLEHALGLLLELKLAAPVTLLTRHPAHLDLARTLKPHPQRRSGPRISPAADQGDVLAWTPESPVAVTPAVPFRTPGRGIPSTRIITLCEPPPWEGPLRALQRLMERHPDERLLLCPVDMPTLTLQVLRALRDAAAIQPELIHLAHDGQRCQPLLGIYPSHATARLQLKQALCSGERRLQSWLASQPRLEVPLDPQALHNVNHRQDLPPGLVVTSPWQRSD